MNNLYIFLFLILLLGMAMGSYLHATAYRYTKDSLDDFYEKFEKEKKSFIYILKEEFKR